MSSPVLAALRAVLPAETLVTDPDLVETYRHDRADLCAAGHPLVVVRARSTEQVSAVLRVASEHRVPVVPQGARSGLSGGANAVDGGIVLSLEAMDAVLEVDVANRLVVTQPGIMNAALSRHVAEHGLFYPPDPSSWEFCSIGGNLATDAGGLCCVKYGVTSDYVLGLEVVLADGSVLRTGRRTVKGVAGYDLTRLMVGSEGTLGVITEATLALRPAANAPRTVAATYADAPTAAAGVAAVLSGPVTPSLLEFMDRTSVRVVDEALRLGFGDEVGAVVLAQSDAEGEQAGVDAAAMAAALQAAGAVDVVVADDAAEGELLLQGRRHVISALETLGATLIDDVCVPRDRLVDLVHGIERLAADSGLTVALVGHAGDGNFHPTIVFDRDDDVQRAAAQALFADVMRLGLELGGTITGEHGIGRLKRDMLTDEVGQTSMRVQRALKDALDPLGILNPGTVL